MGKLIVIALIIAIGYFFGYKRVATNTFTEQDFLQDIEKSNKKLPRDVGHGIVMEKLEVGGKKIAIARATVPVILHKVDTSRLPEIKKEATDAMKIYACTDKIGRYLLDNEVKFKFIFEDKTGHLIMDMDVSKADC